MSAVIKLGRYTQKQRGDNAAECLQLLEQQQLLLSAAACITQQSVTVSAYDDNDDPQVEDFIGIIVQAHHDYLLNVTHHMYQVAIINSSPK